jgi:hypothetical protein
MSGATGPDLQGADLHLESGVFRLRTYHDTVVVATRNEGKVVNLPEPLDPSHVTPALLFIPNARARAAFLFADLPRQASLSMAPTDNNAPIIPFRFSGPSVRPYALLSSPTSGMFLRAVPPAQAEPGIMQVSATAARGWERYTLEAVHDDVPEQHSESLALLAEIFASRSPAFGLAQFLMRPHGPDHAAVANAVGRLLTGLELRALADAVAALARVDETRLADLFPDDIYATVAVPAVLQHLSGPQPERSDDREPVILNDTLDELDTRGIHGQFTSLPYALNVALRSSVVPRRRACVVATARNEGLYLLEWIAYHQVIGFENLIIYSNDNSDGSDELLSALHDARQITWIKNSVGSGRRAQWKAYGHALRIAPEVLDYAWTLVIDLDEFFVPDVETFGSVLEFLDWSERRDVDAIAVNWLLVGANGQTRWRDDPMSVRFRNAFTALRPAIKTMSRACRVVHSFPHHPVPYYTEGLNYLTATGKPHIYDPAVGPPGSRQPSAEHAVILHFYHKSNEELLWKSARNKGDHPFTESLQLSGLETHAIKEFAETWTAQASELPIAAWVPQVMRRLEFLHGLPGIRRAKDSIEQTFKLQMPTLVASALTHPAIGAAGEAGASFMRQLLGH